MIMIRVVRWLAFPLLTGGSVAAVMAALSAGLGPMLVSGAIGAAVAVLVTALERWLPFAPDWNRSHGDLTADLWHLAVNLLIVETLPVALLPDGFLIWPTSWPGWAQFALALVVSDLLSYGVHRLLHGPLWRFHAIHHGAERLYWINSWRTHPVEVLAYFALVVAPLRLLGMPAPIAVVLVAFTTAFRILQHSNVDVRLGPFNHVLAMAEVHRWHHSREPSEAHANYGNVLFVWDHVFRTARLRPGAPAHIGLPADEAPPRGYLDQLAAPFRQRQGQRTP